MDIRDLKQSTTAEEFKHQIETELWQEVGVSVCVVRRMRAIDKSCYRCGLYNKRRLCATVRSCFNIGHYSHCKNTMAISISVRT